MMNKKRPGKIVISLLLIGAMIVGAFSPGALGGLVQAAEVREPVAESAKTNELEEPTQENVESGTETESVKTEEGVQTKETDTTESVSETDPESAIPEEQSESSSGSISGMIWLDENENGTYDSGENPVEGYEVSLYTASDQEHAIDTVITDEAGEYQFAELQPDDYIAGIPLNQSVDGTEYQAPSVGISEDNQFALDVEAEEAYTSTITITSDTAEEDYRAGVHMLPAIQTMSSVGIQPEGSTVYTKNSTVIGFGGYEWWVIGGVTTPANALTLWSKNPDFGASQFKPDIYSGNQYTGSVLIGEMDKLADNFPADDREKGLVKTRAVLNGVGEDISVFKYPVVNNQKFWPISLDEWKKEVKDQKAVRAYGGEACFWLRTPHYNSTMPVDEMKRNADSGYANGGNVGRLVNTTMAMRPAFYLDRSSILFTSDADGDGIKSATAGSKDLAAAKASSGAIKLTVKDDALTIATDTKYITAPPGGTKTFNFSGVSTGPDKSVSVMICEQATNNSIGKILYYGRPVDLSDPAAATSGKATFTVPSDLEVGKDYTLRIFNEEVNGANFTDYAGAPVDITLRIREVKVNLSATPSTDTKVYYDKKTGKDTVDITATIKNENTGTTVEEARWFRVPVSDSKQYNTQEEFVQKFNEITSVADKGVINTASSSEEELNLDVGSTDINATYWVMGKVVDPTITPNDTYYGIGSLTVNNIYTVTPVDVRGEVSENEELYDYEVVSGTYGILYDFGTDVVLPPSSINALLGYDEVTLEAKSPYNNTTYWTWAMKNGGDFKLTLNEDFVDPTINTKCDDGDITKYTIQYTRTANWRPITTHFVDENGTTIPSMGNITGTFQAPVDAGGNVNSFLAVGGSYLPPSVDDYTVIGYKVGSLTGGFKDCMDFTTFNPNIPSGINDVYIVYRANITDLSISNTVTGSYADLTKPFTYTITFYDFNNNPLAVGTEFDYTGGTISGSGATSPASGKLILDNSGSADVSLSNGQSITIAGVPVSGKIQIVQTSADGYTTKYVDSIDPSTDVSSNDTTVKNMTSDDRTFAFNNTRTDVVPAGVFTGSAGSGLFIISALLLGCAACFTVWRFRRRTGDN